ncbi:MAG: hypothetical protein OHK005_13470 [Candidatus Methylacidiphilales bacterium]
MLACRAERPAYRGGRWGGTGRWAKTQSCRASASLAGGRTDGLFCAGRIARPKEKKGAFGLQFKFVGREEG